MAAQDVSAVPAPVAAPAQAAHPPGVPPKAPAERKGKGKTACGAFGALRPNRNRRQQPYEASTLEPDPTVASGEVAAPRLEASSSLLGGCSGAAGAASG